MPQREWIYKGYVIQSYPQGTLFKYVVYISATRLIAASTLAGLTDELDRL